MTDKELRRLKRSELLELMFYLREELDKLKQENESLKTRIDDLSKAVLESRNNPSDEFVRTISDAVKNAVGSCFSEKHQQKSENSENVLAETEQ